MRHKNIEARLQLTQEALLERPAAEWLERLTAAGVPCGPVLSRNQVIRHPQVEALGLVVETDHPSAGRLRQARAAARFSRTPPEIRRGAPRLGEHTQEVLAELGYSAAEIAELRSENLEMPPNNSRLSLRAQRSNLTPHLLVTPGLLRRCAPRNDKPNPGSGR